MDRTYNEDRIECPWCGNDADDPGNIDSSETEFECESCGRTLAVHVEHRLFYQCTRVETV